MAHARQETASSTALRAIKVILTSSLTPASECRLNGKSVLLAFTLSLIKEKKRFPFRGREAQIREHAPYFFIPPALSLTSKNNQRMKENDAWANKRAADQNLILKSSILTRRSTVRVHFDLEILNQSAIENEEERRCKLKLLSRQHLFVWHHCNLLSSVYFSSLCLCFSFLLSFRSC